ncbi:hypothetical protein EVG20_g8679 [Dentipellis fragilis]|uniref:NAD(P)-binding protein n=1 Tax=Dentipellis fragilis TaxID=205917 RepID=A0A4Y9Y3P0_9AGAM|nr:hypothetical protein EVG20_g8679 [Dentipellis fragilis]
MADAWVKNGGKEVLKQAAVRFNDISDDSAFFFPADVATQEGIDNLAKELSSRETSLDVLVNNAGMAWMQQFSLNTWGPAALTSALAPLLVEAAKKGEGRGSVILITSVSESMWFAASPMNGYSLSKAAEAALTKILANKLVAHGVRGNTIAPGTFPSPGNNPANAIMPSGNAEAFVPMKRNGNADDIAEAFLFLATKASAYVTGQKLALDGGWSMVLNGRWRLVADGRGRFSLSLRSYTPSKDQFRERCRHAEVQVEHLLPVKWDSERGPF